MEVTCPPRVQRLVTAVIVAATFTMSGCTDDAPGNGEEPRASAESDTTQQPSEPETPHQPMAVPIERPAFTMELPKGWIDRTDKAMIGPTENEVDALKPKQDERGIADTYVHINFSADSTSERIEEDKDQALQSARGLNPKQRFTGMATFAGEEAVHLAGPGTYDGTYLETYEFLHDGDWFQIQIETYDGKADAKKILEHIESTWEWK